MNRNHSGSGVFSRVSVSVIRCGGERSSNFEILKSDWKFVIMHYHTRDPLEGPSFFPALRPLDWCTMSQTVATNTSSTHSSSNPRFSMKTLSLLTTERVGQNTAMHLPQLLLLPPAVQEPRPKPKRCNRRLACVAAAATVLHCVCSFVIFAAAQKATAEPFGTWSTASLSEARCELAATSLPNHGLAFFAGGNSNSSCSRFCDNCCTSRGCREGWVLRRM